MVLPCKIDRLLLSHVLPLPIDSNASAPFKAATTRALPVPPTPASSSSEAAAATPLRRRRLRPPAAHRTPLRFSSEMPVASTISRLFPPPPSLPAPTKSRRSLVAGGKRWGSCWCGWAVRCACTVQPLNWGEGHSALGSNNSLMPVDMGVGKDVKDDSDVLIECRNVHKSFGEKHILKGVSFKIRHGEAVGIIGPSGTGKSTVLKIMAGLLAPDKGEVRICGQIRRGLVDDEEMSGLRIGLVFQSASLFDSLTVRENVGFLLYEKSRMSEDQITKLVSETLAAVGLKGIEGRFPSELSGGMKKRVALARSIIFDSSRQTIEPEVLLYDEPTAGLDPIASTVVEDLIRSVHLNEKDALEKPGKITSYVVVTHQHSTIRRAVDRLLFLYEGKIVWEGMTHEFTTSDNPIVQQFASGSLDGPIKY